MSSAPNHRRGEARRQDNGPTWEGGPPCSGCNSTHVARSRAKWQRRDHRARRRADNINMHALAPDEIPMDLPRQCGGFRKAT